MRTITEWLIPGRIAGMAAYLLAASSCAVAWVRGRRDKRISHLAGVLGLLETALLFDIAFDWRWKLYLLLRDQAMANQWYDYRRGPQIGMLALLAVLLLAAIGFARRRYRSVPGAVLAIAGALLSIACWSTELISLHATDTLLFHHAGPLRIINYLRALACLMTVIGIWKASG
jgi:hypothetical protein